MKCGRAASKNAIPIPVKKGSISSDLNLKYTAIIVTHMKYAPTYIPLNVLSTNRYMSSNKAVQIYVIVMSFISLSSNFQSTFMIDSSEFCFSIPSIYSEQAC